MIYAATRKMMHNILVAIHLRNEKASEVIFSCSFIFRSDQANGLSKVPRVECVIAYWRYIHTLWCGIHLFAYLFTAEYYLFFFDTFCKTFKGLPRNVILLSKEVLIKFKKLRKHFYTVIFLTNLPKKEKNTHLFRIR